MLRVKHGAIIYTGYEYQTMFGVLLLAQWLNSPTEYERISFEADKDDNDAPQGIDDVICERTDGKVDYYQVKFTPSAYKDENALSWDWLLKRSGKTERSRSLLKKLYDAIDKVPSGKRGLVTLITNKLPNQEVESCIMGDYFDYSKIQPKNQEAILQQLGTETEVIKLFSILKIKHSYQEYESLDRTLKMELGRHSNDAGINRLRLEARTWAMFEDLPSQYGWIYLHNLREILSKQRPRPIPQSFLVPDNYCLPDDSFHERMLQIISSTGEGVFTISGSPGRGKSTYLSYLCNDLEQKNYPLIRHHYFFSNNDQTLDRLSPRVVMDSLLLQIKKNLKDIDIKGFEYKNFNKVLTTCGQRYKLDNIPFIIVIDGLDHVWRDNNENKKPLDELFRLLLPLPENVVLLIGTQPVSDEMLPQTLLDHCPKEKWLWLPAMSGNAIYKYIKHQYISGRLYLNCHENKKEAEVKEAANELMTITSGYPLHVIYSIEELIKDGNPLSSWKVKQLPTLEGESIESYYNKLWRRLSHKQRDVLHLCSSFSFFWPRKAFIQILDEATEKEPSFHAVTHLLYETESGFKPFHESLVVFIRKVKTHKERVTELTPRVVLWLKESAPACLHHGWYWSSLAKIGDTSPLRKGLTRDWVLERLSEGFETEPCIRMLSEAEGYSFAEQNFSEAYTQRALKTRLLNGPEFQAWDYPTLECLSLLDGSQDLIEQYISSSQNYPPIKLAILAIVLWYRGEADIAKSLAVSAIEKHHSESKLHNRHNDQEINKEIQQIIKAGVLTDSLNYEVLLEEGKMNDWSNEYVNTFILSACINIDLDILTKAHHSLTSALHRSSIEASAIRLSLVEGTDITKWDEFEQFVFNPLSHCLKILKEGSLSDVLITPPESKPTTTINIGAISHHKWFFSCLITRLTAQGDFCWIPITSSKERVDVSEDMMLISNLSCDVAELIINSEDNKITFSETIYLFPDINEDQIVNYEERRAKIWLKRDWLEIAADCHLLTTSSAISLKELDLVIANDNFLTSWLRLWYIKHEIPLLSNDAARQVIELEYEEQNKMLEETIERSNGNLELSLIALRHDLDDLFKKHIRLTWDYVIGYGHHKDVGIFDVMSSIEHVSKKSPDDALILLNRISPIVFNISDFTDGDETRHALSTMNSLLAKFSPETLVSKYNQEVKGTEWYLANNSLKSLLHESDFGSEVLQRLCLTGLESDCIQEVNKAANLGNANALGIQEKINKLFGYVTGLEETGQKSTSKNDEKIDLLPNDYPPENLNELINALKGKYSTGSFWLEWFAYWKVQGKEQGLFKVLIPYLEKNGDSLSGVKDLYEPLYDSVRKYKGKKKAFDYLVKIHCTLNGWSRWYESDKTKRKRLYIVAHDYPERVDEFIKKTTVGSPLGRNSEELIIPSDDLVFLLVECGREKEAIDLTNSMLYSLEEETRNLNLSTPLWDWESNTSKNEIYTKALITRLSWPVPSTKLIVSQHLSEMLAGNDKIVEEALLTELAKRKLESECIEVLCVFLMAFDFGYVTKHKLGEYINARSVLSDMIIKEIQPLEECYGSYASSFNPWACIPAGNHQFDRMQGTEVPLQYKSALEREEKRTELPFTSIFRSEWSNTFDYDDSPNGSISYFFGSERDCATGQFYTKNSHRGRSAFLRTLQVAHLYWDMPVNYAETLATLALPLEPAFSRLKPKKPSWLPDWEYSDDINEESIKNFITLLTINITSSFSDRMLGALSFPVKISQNNWLDITIERSIHLIESSNEIPLNDHSMGYSIGEELQRELKFFGNTKKLNSCMKVKPLLGSTFPFTRYGAWHTDFESRGVFVPLIASDKQYVGASYQGKNLKFFYEDELIGEFGHWYVEWSPIHPKPLKSLCGTYTLLDKNNLSVWIGESEKEKPQAFICKIKILTRENTYSDYDVTEFKCIVAAQ
jgi:Cdc6-like AAA superfamily ATPase